MGQPLNRPCGRMDEATETKDVRGTKGVRAVARVDGHLENGSTDVLPPHPFSTVV